MTTPSRTLATFYALQGRYGLPAQIRVGVDAYREFQDESWRANDRLTHSHAGVGVGSNLRFMGVRVEFDESLAPWEVAWDGKVEPRETFHDAMRRIRIEYPDMFTDTCP